MQSVQFVLALSIEVIVIIAADSKFNLSVLDNNLDDQTQNLVRNRLPQRRRSTLAHSSPTRCPRRQESHLYYSIHPTFHRKGTQKLIILYLESGHHYARRRSAHGFATHLHIYSLHQKQTLLHSHMGNLSITRSHPTAHISLLSHWQSRIQRLPVAD